VASAGAGSAIYRALIARSRIRFEVRRLAFSLTLGTSALRWNRGVRGDLISAPEQLLQECCLLFDVAGKLTGDESVILDVRRQVSEAHCRATVRSGYVAWLQYLSDSGNGTGSESQGDRDQPPARRRPVVGYDRQACRCGDDRRANAESGPPLFRPLRVIPVFPSRPTQAALEAPCLADEGLESRVD